MNKKVFITTALAVAFGSLAYDFVISKTPVKNLVN